MITGARTGTTKTCIVSKDAESDLVVGAATEAPASIVNVAVETGVIDPLPLWPFTSEKTVVEGALGDSGGLPANFSSDCGLASPRFPSLGGGVFGAICFPMSYVVKTCSKLLNSCATWAVVLLISCALT